MADDNKIIPQADGTENKKIRMNFGGADIEAAVDKDGRIIMPEEIQNIMAAGMAVMEKASEGQTDKTSKTDSPQPSKLGDESVAGKFKGLPMRELIGAPLFAAAEAQEKLASIAWDYYQRIAYEDDKKTTRLLKFELNRPVVQDGVVSSTGNKVKVEAPFIGLVPIPSLLIDRVDIDFQMEVTDTNSSTDKKVKNYPPIYPPNGLELMSVYLAKCHLHGKIPVPPTRRRSIRYTSPPASNRRPKGCRG